MIKNVSIWLKGGGFDPNVSKNAIYFLDDSLYLYTPLFLGRGLETYLKSILYI